MCCMLVNSIWSGDMGSTSSVYGDNTSDESFHRTVRTDPARAAKGEPASQAVSSRNQHEADMSASQLVSQALR
jgi:hypothetical protein